MNPDQIAKQLMLTDISGKVWSRHTVEYILKNEKYMGDALLQKQYTTETLPRQKKNNNGERDMFYIENFNPAIISREVYQKATELREQRRSKCSFSVREHLLAGMATCEQCGCLMRVKKKGEQDYLICRTHNEDSESCPITQIPVVTIYESFLRLYFNLSRHGADIFVEMIRNLHTIFDLDSECGKMFREPFPAESRKGRTSGSSSKNSSELVSIPFMSLDLTPGAGNLLDEFYWEILSPWRGESLILNTGPAPRSGAAGSTLWSILEERPHPRYFLTRKACQGIIRRASERGKPLPEQLEIALEIQAGLRNPAGEESRNVTFHINQRDEGIDLNGISGALMATRNMQMQTFVTQPQRESAVGFDGYNGDITGEVSATLGTNCGMSTGRNGIIQPQAFAANQRDEVRNLHVVAGALGAQPGMKQQTFVAAGNPNVLCLNDQGGQFMSCSENITGTLRSQMHQHQPLVLKAGRKVLQEPMPRVYENHGIDSRYTGPYEVSPTISARCGTGGNNVPLVSEEPPVYCIVGNVIDREPENGGNGCGYKENIAYTLTAMDRHAVFSRQRTDVFSENNVVSTESARQHKDATDLVMQPYQETVGTLVKSDHNTLD